MIHSHILHSEKSLKIYDYKSRNPKLFEPFEASHELSFASSNSSSSSSSSRANSPSKIFNSSSSRPLTPLTPSIPLTPGADFLPSFPYGANSRIVHPKPQALFQRSPISQEPSNVTTVSGTGTTGTGAAGAAVAVPSSMALASALGLSTPSSYIDSPQEEYLQFLEPSPVQPPSYDTLPPGGCPKYPIITPLPVDASSAVAAKTASSLEALPSYTPAIYKIGVVSRKSEWITPYEPSTSRSWKNTIIELNSTQLNFYQIPSNLENHILQFKSSCSSPTYTSSDLAELNSSLTTSEDLEFYKFILRLGITQKNIVRSYSLQYCKFGLAADYKKKANVMRLRLESEQILLEFQKILKA